MKHLPYNARVFPCPYKCNAYCRSASGLTQHCAACPRNPANRRAMNPTIRPPQTPPPVATSPTTSPLASPAPQTPDRSGQNSRPRTPASVSRRPRTPATSVSPRRCRHQWTTNVRGVRTRVHPYLNGSISLRPQVIPSSY